MAHYFIASALAVVATVSSAMRTELSVSQVSTTYNALSSFEQISYKLSEELYGILPVCPGIVPPPVGPGPYQACPPKPYGQPYYPGELYPFKDNVKFFYNCNYDDMASLGQCGRGRIFDAVRGECVFDKESSFRFECPKRTAEKGYQIYIDPNFQSQYHVCWNYDFYPKQRMTCLDGRLFNTVESMCVPPRSVYPFGHVDEDEWDL